MATLSDTVTLPRTAPWWPLWPGWRNDQHWLVKLMRKLWAEIRKWDATYVFSRVWHLNCELFWNDVSTEYISKMNGPVSFWHMKNYFFMRKNPIRKSGQKMWPGNSESLFSNCTCTPVWITQVVFLSASEQSPFSMCHLPRCNSNKPGAQYQQDLQLVVD